ncbi:hypothetical protein PN466_18765 [Roseofilum reptotaenium CS-1145]|uniref:Uncharacterized protein n=1 Tax=Roseofilum reptotaenium AO1-A TaxID=1925591 RepID=A0A1L9QTP8_9CYAN|nr:hypothetical protein [Roseofilum reptotaenium]MDB9518991.1 hypothetical protein [Roseofilum reptotaenium CS-1145]OJJ25996.1 hypothetical protein BI308_08540 [Roseofilum reptotaenium AO1-A]
MTSVATFEFATNLKINEIKKKLSEFWCNGRRVDVIPRESRNKKEENIYLCVLEYILFEKEEEPKIRLVVDYLLSISSNNQIFYYRDYDVIDLCVQHGNPVEIKIDDLFTKEFCPSISGNIEYQYLIRSTDTSKNH